MKKIGSWRAAIPLVALTMALASCGLAETGPSGGKPTSAVPASHACSADVKTTSRYLGYAAPDTVNSIEDANAFARLVGQRPNLISYYVSFGNPFDASLTCAIEKTGALPVVQINPNNTSLTKIADGFDDNYLSSYAQAVKDFHSPVVISFGHEMNGTWYSWGPNHFSPATFVSAWKQVHDVFSAAGATNVIWLWCPNIVYSQAPSLAPYYPGNNYVDWVGIDGYFRADGYTFESVFGATLEQVAKLTNKPVLIGETGVATSVGRPGIEVHSLFSGVESSKNILGFVWFDSVGSMDWRLEDDPRGLAVFRTDVQQFHV